MLIRRAYAERDEERAQLRTLRSDWHVRLGRKAYLTAPAQADLPFRRASGIES